MTTLPKRLPRRLTPDQRKKLLEDIAEKNKQRQSAIDTEPVLTAQRKTRGGNNNPRGTPHSPFGDKHGDVGHHWDTRPLVIDEKLRKRLRSLRVPDGPDVISCGSRIQPFPSLD